MQNDGNVRLLLPALMAFVRALIIPNEGISEFYLDEAIYASTYRRWWNTDQQDFSSMEENYYYYYFTFVDSATTYLRNGPICAVRIKKNYGF